MDESTHFGHDMVCLTDLRTPVDTTPPPLPDAHPKLGCRALFPDLKHRAYLSHGSISPVGSGA